MAGLGLHVRLIGLSIAMTCAAPPLGAWARAGILCPWRRGQFRLPRPCHQSGPDAARGDRRGSAASRRASDPSSAPTARSISPAPTACARHPDGSAPIGSAPATADEAFLAPPCGRQRRLDLCRHHQALYRPPREMLGRHPSRGPASIASPRAAGSAGPRCRPQAASCRALISARSRTPTSCIRGDATTVLVRWPIAAFRYRAAHGRLPERHRHGDPATPSSASNMTRSSAATAIPVVQGRVHAAARAYCLLPPIGFQPSAPRRTAPTSFRRISASRWGRDHRHRHRRDRHLPFGPSISASTRDGLCRARASTVPAWSLTAATVLPNGEA